MVDTYYTAERHPHSTNPTFVVVVCIIRRNVNKIRKTGHNPINIRISLYTILKQCYDTRKLSFSDGNCSCDTHKGVHIAFVCCRTYRVRLVDSSNASGQYPIQTLIKRRYLQQTKTL